MIGTKAHYTIGANNARSQQSPLQELSPNLAVPIPTIRGSNEGINGVPAYRSNRDMTLEEVMELYDKTKSQFVSLLHIGTDGWVKSLDFAPFSSRHLRDILTSGERADGYSLFQGSGLSTSSSDICLRPRLSSAFVHPFTSPDEPPGICVLCDHLDRNGQPLAQSPSTILQKAHARVTKECNGLKLYALGEVEYFLGRPTALKTSPADSVDKTERGYHATSPFLFGTKMQRQAIEILTGVGYHVKYGHGEVGFIPADEDREYEWEQHEIEMSLMPLDKAADAVVLCQWILRNLADEAGFLITFDPIVESNHAGNGLHFHMSPTRAGYHLNHYRDGNALDHLREQPIINHKHLFHETQALIAGLCLCGGSLMAWGNRSSKSFQRLLQGKEVPKDVQWDFFNRKALVRLPIQSQNAQGKIVTPATVEFRLGDGSAQPHLLLAGISQAFAHAYLLEEKARLAVVDRCHASATHSSGVITNVPHNFDEVGALLERDRGVYLAGSVFPSSFIDQAIATLPPYAALS